MPRKSLFLLATLLIAAACDGTDGTACRPEMCAGCCDGFGVCQVSGDCSSGSGGGSVAAGGGSAGIGGGVSAAGGGTAGVGGGSAGTGGGNACTPSSCATQGKN